MGWTDQKAYWRRRRGKLSLEEAVKMSQVLEVKDAAVFLTRMAEMQGMVGEESTSPLFALEGRKRHVVVCTKCGDATHKGRRCPRRSKPVTLETQAVVARAKAKPASYYRPKKKAARE